MLVKWHISSKDNCYQKAAMEVHSRKREASRHVKLLISGSKRFTRTQGTPLFTGRFGWNFHCWFLMATDFGNNATMVGTLYTSPQQTTTLNFLLKHFSLCGMSTKVMYVEHKIINRPKPPHRYHLFLFLWASRSVKQQL